MTTTYTIYSNAQVLGFAGSPANLLSANALGSVSGVAAFFDGEMRARIFDASVALPTMNTAFNPPGTNAYAASPTSSGLYQFDSTGGTTYNGVVANYSAGFPYGVNTGAAIGQYLFSLVYTAGGTDAGSPSVFEADQYLSLVTCNATTG